MSEAQQQAATYLQQQLGSTYPGLEIVPEGNGGLSVEVMQNEVFFHVDANALNVAIQSGQPMTGVVSNAGGAGIGDNNPLVSSNSASGGLGSQLVLCCDAGENGYEILYDVSQQLNVGIDNWNGVGFSAGGPGTIEAANDFLTSHPECKDNFRLFLADGYWESLEQFEGHDALRDVDMFFTVANPGDSYYAFRNNNAYNGLTAEEMYRAMGFKTHVMQSNIVFENGNQHMELGYLTLNVVLAGDENSSSVTILKFDPSQQKYVADDLVLNSATLGGAFSIKLKNEDLALMQAGTVGENTVLSDVVMSMQHINTISDEMNNNSGLFSPETQSLGSTASIASGIVSAQNAYLSISNDLHHRVRLELGLITDITQRYYDMDGDLASLASTLKSGGTSIASLPNEVYTQLSDMLNISTNNASRFYKNYQVPTFAQLESIGTISKSEILALGSSNGAVMQNLQADMVSARRTQQALETFENDIGVHFKGDAWNAVKGNLSLLAATQGIRISSCESLMSAITQATNLIADYMGDDAELNTAEIPVLSSLISSLQAELAAMVTESYYDIWSKSYSSRTVPKLQGAARASAEQSLREAQAAYDKLVGLGPVIQNATNIVNTALQEMYNSFGVAVDGLSIGTVEPYVPSFSTSISSGVSSDSSPISTMPAVPTMKYSPTHNTPGTIVDVDPLAIQQNSMPNIGSPVGSSGGSYGGSSGGSYGNGGGGSIPSQIGSEDANVPQIPEDDKVEEIVEEDDEIEKPVEEEKEDTVVDNEPDEELVMVERPTVSRPGSSSYSSRNDMPSAYIPPKGTSSVIGTPMVDESVLENVIDTSIEEPVIEELVDTPVEELPPIVEDSIGEVIGEEVVDEVIKELPKDTPKKESGNGAGAAIATVVGLGTAVGAAAYGAHRYIKSREENEDYDSSDDGDDY